MSKHLTTAVLTIFKPLVSLMLRSGISFGEASTLLKQAYVKEAENELQASGEKRTTSRISILTGLTRKDVASLRKKTSPQDLKTVNHNRAIRVIGGWNGDSKYCNDEGNAKVLQIQGCSESFESLVNKYSGDMPYRAVLNELIRTGAVEKIGNDNVVLVRSAYVSSDDENEKYSLLGEDVTLLVKTIKHNIVSSKEESFYQRKVLYDSIPRKKVDEFKILVNRENQLLLLKLNSWLLQHDQAHDKQIMDEEAMTLGVGIYYFEESTKNNESKKNED